MESATNDLEKADNVPVVPVTTSTMDAAARNGASRPMTTAAPSPALVYSEMGGDLEQVVYPVGVTRGIDRLYSEHVNNIPCHMPTKTEVNSFEARQQYPEDRKIQKVRLQSRVRRDGRHRNPQENCQSPLNQAYRLLHTLRSLQLLIFHNGLFNVAAEKSQFFSGSIG